MINREPLRFPSKGVDELVALCLNARLLECKTTRETWPLFPLKWLRLHIVEKPARHFNRSGPCARLLARYQPGELGVVPQ